MTPPAILSNFFEKQWTQNHQQYLSGLSRALYPKTFLEIAVYVKNYSWFVRNFQYMYVFISISKNNFNLAPSLGVALEKDLNAVENFFQTQILIKAINFPHNKEQIKWNKDL